MHGARVKLWHRVHHNATGNQRCLAWRELPAVSPAGVPHGITTNKETPMSLRRILAIVAFILPLSLMQAADPAVLHEDDQAFIKKATTACLIEIRSSEAALKRTLTAEELSFARQLISDHGKVNDELAAIAKKKNVTPPAGLAADEQEKVAKMSEVKDKDFNEEFLEHAITCHKKSIDLFEDQAEDGKDADLKAFAIKTLPHLKAHLETAKKLEAKY